MLSTHTDFTRLIDCLIEAHRLAVSIDHKMLKHIIEMALLEAAHRATQH